MDAQLTTAELEARRSLLQDYLPAQEALATLEKHNGRLDAAFDELWIDKNGSPTQYDLERLRRVTLKQLRQEVCGDEGFRTQIKEYSKNPGSAPLLTGLIVYLVGLAATGGFPLDPAIATVVVLYILKIGLNIFCDYTEASGEPPADGPES